MFNSRSGSPLTSPAINILVRGGHRDLSENVVGSEVATGSFSIANICDVSMVGVWRGKAANKMFSECASSTARKGEKDGRVISY